MLWSPFLPEGWGIRPSKKLPGGFAGGGGWSGLELTDTCITVPLGKCSLSYYSFVCTGGLFLIIDSHNMDGNENVTIYFSVFLLKNWQQKSSINDSLVNLWGNKFKKSLWKKIRWKPASVYQKKTSRFTGIAAWKRFWSKLFPTRCVTHSGG